MTHLPELTELTRVFFFLSAQQEEPRIYVESEDQPNRVLLETRISKDDGYQKQQGFCPTTAGSSHRRRRLGLLTVSRDQRR